MRTGSLTDRELLRAPELRFEKNQRHARKDSVKADEVVTAVRCPCCRHVLVAVMGRAGPYFRCSCEGVIN
jgi:hypothetical protein